MKTSTITFEIPESRLQSLTAELQDSIKADCGTEYPLSTIRNSVVDWLGSRLDVLLEDAFDRLTSPSFEDARDFARMLDEGEKKAEIPKVADAAIGAVNIFTGHRTFSLEKMAAMVSYFAERTNDLYKTKLNKLLFYADFTNYYTLGKSISGSRYVHLPYGPVPDAYEETLETLNHYGVVDVSKENSADLIRSGENAAKESLNPEEIATLDWIAENYGSMSASQLTEISHREMAYANTRTGEEIAYEYAKFLAKLPAKKG
ncbi:MAG: hypothetical protein DMF63_05745 [Acidobacteria bacterium]|nr:MAG: hypothetical protein DMF63_05745 [Acidobacteriota bacterium]